MSFNELIEAFDIEGWLDSYSKLRKSGATNHVANPCPLCGDRKNKFYINTSGGEHNGRWNSYCCHSAGGLVDLVMKVEMIGRIEALSLIRASVEGEPFDLVPVIAQPVVTPGQLEQPTDVFPTPLAVAQPNSFCMIQGRPGALSERGISDYIIERHGLRLTEKNTYYRGERRFDLDYRLVIPVKFPGNSTEAWTGWQGRDLTGGAKMRYVFPTGDRSSETLYDFDGFLAGRGNTLLIVEGVFGKWAWDSLGRNIGRRDVEHMAVASFGKKLTKEQEALIVNTPQITSVIIGWDLDAAAEIIKVAQRLNGRKKVLIMPAHVSGRDHDELSDSEKVQLLMGVRAYDLSYLVELRTKLALQGI